MIDRSKLDSLYSSFNNKNIHTTKELLELGFTNGDLTKLLDDGILIRVKRGYYECVDIKKIYSLGQKLLLRGFSDKAEEYFLKCLKLDPNHGGANFRLFALSIKRNDYDSAFKYLEKLRLETNPYYVQDYNLYLYMMGLITDIPENLQTDFNNLDYSKCKALDDDKRYNGRQDEFNKIVMLIFTNKLIAAKREHFDFKVTECDPVLQLMLYQAIGNQKKNQKEILSKIKNKEYESALNQLRRLNKQNMHIYKEEFILTLLSQILNFIRGGVIATKPVSLNSSLRDCIDSGCYDLALKKQLDYDAKSNFDSDFDPVIILIRDLQELVSKSKIKPVPYSNTFDNIAKCLFELDIETSFKLLRQFLRSIGKAQYEDLIINLIKQSVIEKDLTFTRPIYYLTLIKDDKFSLTDAEVNSLLEKTKYKINSEAYGAFILDLKEKCDELCNNKCGVVLLDPLPRQALISAINFIKKYRDITYFTINDDGEERLVLRYKSFNHFSISLKEYMEKSKELFYSGDYEGSIQCCLRLLSVGNPSQILYYYLGRSYLKIGNFSEALKYFTICDALNAAQKTGYDFNKTLCELKRYQKQSNIKGYQYIFRLNEENKED